ncbi:MAG: DUF2000 domain-containing protein [Alphaproteobacteria bacterium]|nr:DUF2000 domain-containing protein [Alphaproteobacteria bacterium]
MLFDSKIVVALRLDLDAWQKLNVAAFLASAVAGKEPALIGQPYADGSGVPYLAMFRQPVLVLSGSAAELKQAHQRALARNLRVAVYVRAMFETGHDEANRAAVKAVRSADLDIVGLGLHEDRKVADKVTKGLVLHP